MRTVIAVMILLASFSLSAGEIGQIEACKDFKNKLAVCEAYKCSRDIGEPGFTSETYFLGHEITGLSKDGRCHHIQTVSDGVIECYYTERTRKIMSGMNGTMLSEEDSKYMSEAFERECLYREKKISENDENKAD